VRRPPSPEKRRGRRGQNSTGQISEKRGKELERCRLTPWVIGEQAQEKRRLKDRVSLTPGQTKSNGRETENWQRRGGEGGGFSLRVSQKGQNQRRNGYESRALRRPGNKKEEILNPGDASFHLMRGSMQAVAGRSRRRLIKRAKRRQGRVNSSTNMY